MLPPIYVEGFFVADAKDRQFMDRALQLAALGKGRTSPNPMVGAVVVAKGIPISEGYHRRAGSAHAELVALRKAGKAAHGATLFVTLEPCCHTGNTGPCTEAIIKAGIKRVVYSVGDPDPRVRGKGAAQLRRAGLDVSAGLMRKESVLLNEIYFHNHARTRPFVILKLAMTLDGQIAAKSGESRWITSASSRRQAHRLRSEVDAVVVGSGTVRKDNPSLTVRHVKGADPYRIVLSESMKLPRNCDLISSNDDGKLILVSSEAGIKRYSRSRAGFGLTYWTVRQSRNGRLDLVDFLDKAKDFGIRSMMIEGGQALASSFIKAGLVDRFDLFIAPKILGQGTPAIADLGNRKIEQALALVRTSVTMLDNDIYLTGYPAGRK